MRWAIRRVSVTTGGGDVCEQYWRHSHSVRLFELAHLLDLIHQVTAVDVLHDEVEAVLGTGGETSKGETRAGEGEERQGEGRTGEDR